MVIIDEKDSQLAQEQLQQQGIPDTAPPPYPGLPFDNAELQLNSAAAVAGSSNNNANGAEYYRRDPPPFSTITRSSPPVQPSAPAPAVISAPRVAATLKTLPPHLLLYIVHCTLPGKDKILTVRTQASVLERSRKILYWILICLRGVNRAFYVASMHVLRSTYLPAYSSMIRQPYSSDPFPLASPPPPADSANAGTPAGPSHTSTRALSQPSYMVSPVNAVQRETAVLDLFLAAKVHEDVWADDTELHLEREEAFSDLFELMQPRARLEDLVREYGVAAGVVAFSAPGDTVVTSCAPLATSSTPVPTPTRASFPITSASASASPMSPIFPSFSGHPAGPSSGTSATTSSIQPETQTQTHERALPFSALSCSFSPRSAGVVYSSRSGKRTIVEVRRSRDERLEVAARRLVRALQAWIAEN